MQTKDVPSRAARDGIVFDKILAGRFLFFCTPDYGMISFCVVPGVIIVQSMKGAFGNQRALLKF